MAITRPEYECFSFGGLYLAEVGNGKCVQFHNLEDALAEMARVYGDHIQCTMRVDGVVSTYDPLGQRNQRLFVETIRPSSKREWYSGEALRERIRRAVTMYNLSQSWGHLGSGHGYEI